MIDTLAEVKEANRIRKTRPNVSHQGMEIIVMLQAYKYVPVTCCISISALLSAVVKTSVARLRIEFEVNL